MSNELALNLYKKYKGKVNSGTSSGKTYYKGSISLAKVSSGVELEYLEE